MSSLSNTPLHVLLADDDADDLLLFNEAIEQSELPLTFSHAEDGNELLKQLDREQSPDILFLDVNMPYRNGIECLHEIRSNGKYKSLPIVIYSTTNYRANIDACFNGGANLYVVKPNTFDEILKLVRKVCNKDWWAQNDTRTPDRFILSEFE